MALEKIYTPIGWQNKPSTATPLGSHNLSKIDEALAEIDERVVELSEDTEALDQRVEDAETDITKNADDITSLNNSFTGFSTAMSQGMELLFDKAEEAEAKIEKNTEDINALKIVPTASGNTAYIADASNMNLENIIFYGESKQMQTTGKQFLDTTSFKTTTGDISSVSGNGYEITSKGGVNNGYSFSYNDLKNVDLLKGKTIYFKADSIVGTNADANSCVQLRVTLSDGSNQYYGLYSPSLMSRGIEIPSNTTAIQFGLYSNNSGTKLTSENTTTAKGVRIVLSEDDTWEPYTGGKAAPNPDYPQPIESKTVNRVDVLGKNLLDCNGLSTWATNGITFTPVYENGLLKYINVNGTATANAYYTCKTTNIKGGSYVLTGFENPSSNYRSYLNSGGVEIVSDVRDNGNFSIASDSDIVFVIKVSSGITMNNVKCYPMVRLAAITDSTYEPYQSQTKSLASGTYRLDGIGDLKNYYDAKRGVYGGKVKRVTFDGSDDEHWATYDTGSGKKRLYSNSVNAKSNINNSTIPNILCSHYKPVTPTNTFYDIVGITISTGANPVLYLYDDVFNDGDIAKWRAHLQANPMTVVYEVAEPEEGNLISSVKDDFAEFLKLHTYKPNTVVMNGADAEMDVQYVADPRLYIDQKFETLAKAIVNQ